MKDPATTETDDIPAVLFAWNPKRWEWGEGDMNAKILQVQAHGSAAMRWSSGNRHHLPSRTRFFLIRLGRSPRGLIGSGLTTTTPYLGDHWDASRRGKAYFVDVRFDFLARQPMVSWEELRKPPFSKVHWGIQASGVALSPDVTKALESLWKRRTLAKDPLLPEEIPLATKLPAGARRRITVNAYERNPLARAACIAHAGFRCSVCDVLLEECYGRIAAEFIHVHHSMPVANIPPGYKVNPRKELHPVCPNCHAIIHLADPPLSISRARKLLKKPTK